MVGPRVTLRSQGKGVSPDFRVAILKVDQVSSTAFSTLILYFIFAGVGFVCSIVSPIVGPLPSGLFSLFQVLTLLQDLEGADKANRILQNITGAVVNGSIGWLLGDYIAYASAVAVGGIAFLKILDKF